MNFFSDALSRLKYELRVSKDGEVAAALGMSKTAFAERKRRGAFPEREMKELAQQRPDLHIDVGYVLTGDSADPTRAMREGERRWREQDAARQAAWKEAEQMAVQAASPSRRPASDGSATVPSREGGAVTSLPAPADGTLTWRQILVIAVDELNAAGKRLPGDKLLELVDLLMAWQAEGAKVDAEKMRAQIRVVA